jgi:hypothetical protein
MGRVSMLAAVLLSGSAACSSSSGSSGDHQPPVLANLVVNNLPSSIPVGQLTTISGSFSMTDSDGDAQTLQVSAQAPGVQPVSSSGQPQGVSGQTSATVEWSFFADPPAAGSYTVSLTMIDTEGQTSNALSFNVTVQ